MADTTEAADIADIATRAAEPKELIVDELLGVVVPDGATLELVDLEKYGAAPRRKQGSVTLHTAGSLAAYTQTHREASTALFADADTFTIVAVINGHGHDGPGFGDHRASVTLRKSPEWKRWESHDRAYLNQVDFAELVEEGIDDVVAPPAADLLELALTFQANTNVAFRQGANLASGERQFLYEETIDAKAGRKGELVIPKGFTLRLRPFEGTEPRDVEARLRYRLRDGRLTLGYFLDRPADVLRDSFDETLRQVEASVDITPYMGKA